MSHIMLFLLWEFTLLALGYDIPAPAVVFLILISAVIDGVRLAAWLDNRQ